MGSYSLWKGKDAKYFARENGYRYVQLSNASSVFMVNHPDEICDNAYCGWDDEFNFDHVNLLHGALNRLCKDTTCSTYISEKQWTEKTAWGPKREWPPSGVCKFYLGPEDEYPTCPLLEQYMPMYLFATAPDLSDEDIHVVWWIVHPDERERMQRILNGTDNPLYDLVHELRYNPNMPSCLSTDRQEAEERFEQAKKRKV
jgi:hypothetical protein